MRHLKLLSSLILVGSVLLLAAPASADEIDFGANTLGSISISCIPGGPCSLSLSAPVGTPSSGFSGADFVYGGGSSAGWYQFSGGPSSITSMTTTNAGLTFTASGTWIFNFADANGDKLTNATATWTSFFNASALGFQVGQLTLSGGSCTNGSVNLGFCKDFGNGGTIDVTLENMPTDLATLYNNGTGETPVTGVGIEGGSVTAAVPEPGTLALFGTGLLSLAGLARRRFGKF